MPYICHTILLLVVNTPMTFTDLQTRKNRMAPQKTIKTTVRWHIAQRNAVEKIIGKLQKVGRMDLTTAFHEAMDLWIAKYQ